jgi:hypothetical protein
MQIKVPPPKAPLALIQTLVQLEKLMKNLKSVVAVKSIFTLCLSLLSIPGLLFQPASRPAAASTAGDVIAYVSPNDLTGDEIHYINPDGTHDREIWSTAKTRLTSFPDVAQLAWKPDASELAFGSTFQDGCSVYGEDIYAIRADGANFHRVTAPPACGANPGLPTGTVQLVVWNYTGQSGTYLVYIEGAPGPQDVTLSDYGSAMVTFTNVMDYGTGIPQWAVGIYGFDRYSDVSSHVDVIAGQSVAATLSLFPMQRDWSYPSYNSDGTRMAYIQNPGTFFYTLSASTNPGGVGWKLLADGVSMPMSPSHLQWGRGSHANQVLYLGYDTNTWPYTYGFYLADEGSASPGIKEEAVDVALGLTWLPDGSGFLYSATQQDPDTLKRYGNIFEFDFNSRTSTQLSHFTSGYTRELSISPEGDKVVFEYQADGDWGDTGYQIDLWMMNRDGSGAALFIPNAQSPAWSPAALPDHYETIHYDVALPIIIK